ncbi:MAG: hypothetical protein NTU97_04075 [Candidatus Magasanikbacteria bacterium]|nr:hypothetical protein [Candidatus Magasanikbacteria bacterium]
MAGVQLPEEHGLYGKRLIVAMGHNGRKENLRCAFLAVDDNWLSAESHTPVSQALPKVEKPETLGVPQLKTKTQKLVRELFGTGAVIIWEHKEKQPSSFGGPPAWGSNASPLVGKIPPPRRLLEHQT